MTSVKLFLQYWVLNVAKIVEINNLSTLISSSTHLRTIKVHWSKWTAAGWYLFCVGMTGRWLMTIRKECFVGGLRSPHSRGLLWVKRLTGTTSTTVASGFEFLENDGDLIQGRNLVPNGNKHFVLISTFPICALNSERLEYLELFLALARRRG